MRHFAGRHAALYKASQYWLGAACYGEPMKVEVFKSCALTGFFAGGVDQGLSYLLVDLTMVVVYANVCF